MKLLAIELTGLALGAVLSDERHEHLRRLLDAGTFGGLTGDAGTLVSAVTGVVERHQLDGTNEPDDLNAELGSRLESVSRDTAVLVVVPSSTGEDGWYALAAPGSVPTGETGDVDAAHLADVVSELLAREVESEEDDDEAMLRERFSGLGYIS